MAAISCCERKPESVIVIVIEADAGAPGLAGLAADRKMRAQLDLDGDFARRRGDALADPDVDPRGNVLTGTQRGAAYGAGGRAGRARTQPEPIQTKTAAQLVENAGTTAGQGGGGRSQLQPLAGAELTDVAVEQHAREDLVLRHGRCRAQCHFRRRGNSADMNLCGNVGGARLGDDVEIGIQRCAACKCDPAARYREGLAQQVDATADLIERAADHRCRARSGDRQLAAPLAVEPVPADEYVAGQVDLDVEGRREGWRLVCSGGRGW